MSSTSLQDFRAQYLARAKTRLTGVDLDTAGANELIVAAALLRSYDSVNRFDAITPEALAPLETMTGEELEDHLQDPDNWVSFKAVVGSSTAMTAVIGSPTALSAVVGSSTAMTAVAASSTAMTAVIGSPTALSAVVGSSTAMTAVAASSTAMTAVIGSPTALSAVRQSSTALTAINASGTALNALYAASTKYNWAGGSYSGNPATLVNGNYLLVRITTKGNPAGWANGTLNEYVKIGGALFDTTTSASNGTNNMQAQATNPFIQDNAARAVNSATITHRFYNPVEIAYLSA